MNSDGLDPGRHTGRIYVESNGGIKTGRISLYIPSEAPVIHFFVADPEHIDRPEGETTLSWEVYGATSVIIDGVGPVEVSKGSIQRWVSQTTTFTIRATNNAGTSYDEVTVTIEKQPPKLYVDPDLLDIGSIDKGEIKSKTFSILIDGDGPLNWNIREYPSFITVSPSYGTEPSTVTVSVDTTMLESGDYSIDMIVESDHEEKVMYVYFNIP